MPKPRPPLPKPGSPCVKCGQPVKYGQSYCLLEDAEGGALMAHVWCPKPEPEA